MSTLYVDDVAGQGGGTSTNLMSGLAKAWVGEYDQTGPTTKDTYNISSITDVAAGQRTDNFTNNQGGSDYYAAGAHSNSANPVGQTWATADDKTTALCDIRSRAANTGTFADHANNNCSYMGDLA